MKHKFNESVEYDLMTSEYGQELSEWYQVIEPIYRSSNSEIFLASNGTGELFTIKAIKKRDDVAFDLGGLSKIKHPRISGIVCHGESEGFLYVVKPYIKGRNLREAIDEDGVFDEDQINNILLQLIDIFAYLHGLTPAVIYRDLKPENLIIDEDGHITLIDIITGRQLNKGKRHDTFHVGTAGFASPEQYGYRQTDERTDIYAIGSTIYYLATGQVPDMEAFDTYILSDRINALVHKCMAFNPDDRFGYIGQLKDSLEGKKTFPIRRLAGLAALVIAVGVGLWQLGGQASSDGDKVLSDNTASVDISQDTDKGLSEDVDTDLPAEVNDQTNSDSDSSETESLIVSEDSDNNPDNESQTDSDIEAAESQLDDDIEELEANRNEPVDVEEDLSEASSTDLVGSEDETELINDEVEEMVTEVDNSEDLSDESAEEVPSISQPVIAYDIENIHSYEDIFVEDIQDIGHALDMEQVLGTIYFKVDKTQLNAEQENFTHITVGATDQPISDQLLQESIYGAVIMGYGTEYYREVGFRSAARAETTNYLVLIFNENYYCVGYAYVEDYTAVNYGFIDYDALDPAQPGQIANVLDNGVVLYYNATDLNLEVNQDLLSLESDIAFISVVGVEGEIGTAAIKSVEDNVNAYAVPFDRNDNYFTYHMVGHYKDVNYLILLMDADRQVMYQYVAMNIP